MYVRMRTISQELVVASLLLTAPAACGFVPTKLSGSGPITTSNAPSFAGASLFSSAVPAKLPTGKRDVSMAIMLDTLDMVITTAIFGAAVAATVKLSENADEVMDDDGSPAVTVYTPTTAEEPVVEKVVEVKKEAKVSVPAEEESAVQPASAPEKDISQIRNEVASTIEEQREKERRLADAKRKRNLSTPSAVAEETVAESIPVTVTDTSDEPEGEVVQEKKKKGRFIGKLATKIIMPWKKWSNL